MWLHGPGCGQGLVHKLENQPGNACWVGLLTIGWVAERRVGLQGAYEVLCSRSRQRWLPSSPSFLARFCGLRCCLKTPWPAGVSGIDCTAITRLSRDRSTDHWLALTPLWVRAHHLIPTTRHPMPPRRRTIPESKATKVYYGSLKTVVNLFTLGQGFESLSLEAEHRCHWGQGVIYPLGTC